MIFIMFILDNIIYMGDIGLDNVYYLIKENRVNNLK